MKLIDLLVRELPKRGGWPDGVIKMIQDHDGEVWRWSDNSLSHVKSFAFLNEVADNHRKRGKNEHPTCFVTREQYEAALAASQNGEWDGVWFPPVGCECEARFIMGGEWFFFHCVAVDCEIAFGWSGKEPVALNPSDYEFRPIRSESDNKRDEAKHAIAELCRSSASNGHSADLIYDAIAAGKIPGVRIE